MTSTHPRLPSSSTLAKVLSSATWPAPELTFESDCKMSSDARLEKWIKERIVELVETSPRPPAFPVAKGREGRRAAAHHRGGLIGIGVAAGLAAAIAFAGLHGSGGTAG